MPLHELLSRLEWAEGLPLDEMCFLVVDRGAADGARLVGPPEVVGRDRSYLHLAGGGRIPYHRVLEVWNRDRLVWRKVDVRDERDGEGQ
ncbi:MAG: DUF504 domain-containing protein [Thermoplasmata archaeon]|nr:DUF504 domain-containing protein [Thermoplasmata archaeon]